MVTITDFETKTTKDDRTFILLHLTGGPEMVQSAQTGKFYMTQRRCKVSATFDESVAKTLVGTQMPGKIVRVPCEAYTIVDEETAEEITLVHRWGYLPENAEVPLVEA